jgi:hypothetical protein
MPIYERHPLLYHYTTFDGLLGIWTTKTLHATRYTGLNDSEETKALKSIISDAFEDKEDIDKYIQLMYKGIFGDDINVFFNPYIVSFCSHTGENNKYEQSNGLLSQWRGYGERIGCAIVFDTMKLHRLVCDERDNNFSDRRNVFFEDVYYSAREFHGKFKNFSSVVKTIIERTGRGDSPEMDNDYRILTRAMCLFKHEGFREEAEVRIVLSPTILEQQIDNIAQRRNLKVKEEHFKQEFKPYIKLFDSYKIDQLPIVKIIVGPAHDNSYWRDRIHYLVRGAGIEVTCSETPANQI